MTDITKTPLGHVPPGWHRCGGSGSYSYRHKASGLCVHGCPGVHGLFWSWSACGISNRDMKGDPGGPGALTEALDAARAHVEKLAAKLEEV